MRGIRRPLSRSLVGHTNCISDWEKHCNDIKAREKLRQEAIAENAKPPPKPADFKNKQTFFIDYNILMHEG